MDLLERAKSGFRELNATLISEGDAARVRYVSLEPDYDYEDGWIMLVTWGGSGTERRGVVTGPAGTGTGRGHATRVGDAGAAHCLFRTPDELAEPGHQRGALLQTA